MLLANKPHTKTNCGSFLLALAVFLAFSSVGRTQRIETEHLFGFMIGTDVGETGDKEVEAEAIGRWGKRAGSYFASSQSFEAEFVPVENVRLSGAGSAVEHDISGVPDLVDRREWTFDALSFDVRYRLLDRERTGVGLAINAEPHWGRVDETSGEPAIRYGADLALLFDKEIVQDRVVAALNLLYQPELSQARLSGVWSQEAAIGTAVGIMAQLRPGILIGAETRYLRLYQGLMPGNFEGQALFLGPTFYARLSRRLWVIAAASAQVAGHAAKEPGWLDLRHFERYQAKLQFGLEF